MSNGGAQPLGPLALARRADAAGDPGRDVPDHRLAAALFWGLQSARAACFAMPVVFAWAVIRPSMLAPVGVMFLMGFYLDILLGQGPLGLWPVCSVAALWPGAGRAPCWRAQSRLVMWAWFLCGHTHWRSRPGTSFTTMLDARMRPALLSVALAISAATRCALSLWPTG